MTPLQNGTQSLGKNDPWLVLYLSGANSQSYIAELKTAWAF